MEGQLCLGTRIGFGGKWIVYGVKFRRIPDHSRGPYRQSHFLESQSSQIGPSGINHSILGGLSEKLHKAC